MMSSSEIPVPIHSLPTDIINVQYQPPFHLLEQADDYRGTTPVSVCSEPSLALEAVAAVVACGACKMGFFPFAL